MQTDYSTTRKVTEKLLKNQNIALNGVSYSVDKSTVSKAIKTYAKLKYRGQELAVLDTLLSCIQQNDLTIGGRPIVVYSNEELARQHALAIRTVQRYFDKFVADGLIAYCDSPNGKRYSARELGGRRFGLDFTPAVENLEELKERARELRVAKNSKLTDQKQIAKLQRRVKGICGTLSADCSKVAAWIAQAHTINQDSSICYAERLKILRGIVWDAEARQKLENVKNHEDLTLGEIIDNRDTTVTHNTNTQKPIKYIICSDRERKMRSMRNSSNELSLKYSDKSVNELEEASEKKPEAIFEPDKDLFGLEEVQISEKTRVLNKLESMDHGFAKASRLAQIEKHKFHECAGKSAAATLTPRLLRDALTDLRDILRIDLLCFDDLFEHSQELQLLNGISKSAFDHAEQAAGSFVTHISMAVIAEKRLRDPECITSSGGYFRRMIERAERGELHLQKTIFGLIKRPSGERLN